MQNLTISWFYVRSFVAAFILVLTCQTNFAQIVPFEKILGQGAEDAAIFTWENPQSGFTLKANGQMRFAPSGKTVKLPTGRGFFINHALFTTYRSDLLLAYSTYSGGDGYSFVCRVQSKTAFIRWCKRVADLEPRPVLGNQAIWLISFYFTARIDPKNGRFVWQNRDNYQAFGHLATDVCLVEESNASITLQSHSEKDRQVFRKIELDRNTGEILRVQVLWQRDAKTCIR
jgi:hypothetical protein